MASTCAEGMIATSIATGSHRRVAPCALSERDVRWTARGFVAQPCHDRSRARERSDPRRRRRSARQAAARARLGLPVGARRRPRRRRTRCSSTASSTTRAGIASSTTATTTTRRSRSTSASTSRRWRAWLRDSAGRGLRDRARHPRDARPDGDPRPRRGAARAARVRRATAPRGRARWRGSSAATSGPPSAARRGPRSSRGSTRSCSRASPRRTRSTRRSPGSTRASARGRCGRSRARRSRAPWRSTTATSAAPPPKRAWRPRERQVKPHEMYTVELLAITESSRWAQIAEELATRTTPYDVELLVAAANAPDLPMRRAAIVALGRQGRREVLEIAERNTSQAERGKLQGAIALALEAMPLSQTRALAHDWLGSDDWARRRKAAGMLAAWAEDEDVAPRAVGAGARARPRPGRRRLRRLLAGRGAGPLRRPRPVRRALARVRGDPVLRTAAATSSRRWPRPTRRSAATSPSSASTTASARCASSPPSASTAASASRPSASPSSPPTRRKRPRSAAPQERRLDDAAPRYEESCG